MDKNGRIAVYENTVNVVKKGYYISPNDEEVQFTDVDKMVNGTKFYGKKAVVDYDNIPRYDTEIRVVNCDCMYLAKRMIDDGYNPCMLNMASFHTPGGGVINGSSAQEEEIFRRSNIFKSLYQFHNVGLEYGVKQREERYPLDYNFGGIYTPSVNVFKNGPETEYEYLYEPFKVAVVSVAAIKNPSIDTDGRLKPWVCDTLKSKIRQILDISLENGHDSLVLSAFGCGAYKTPPKEMARLFHEVIFSKRYKGAFKVINFAIINVPTTNGKHNPQGNFKPFADVFNV